MDISFNKKTTTTVPVENDRGVTSKKKRFQKNNVSYYSRSESKHHNTIAYVLCMYCIYALYSMERCFP